MVEIFDYVVLLVITAGGGLVGGVVAKALQDVVPTTNPGPAGQAISWPVSLLIGAVAAVAFLYFFPPEITVTERQPGGKIETSSTYSLIKVTALSLIVGSGGRAFLTSMQAKTAALLSQQTASNVVRAGTTAVDQVTQEVKADVPEKVQASIARHLPELRGVMHELARTVPPELRKALQSGGMLDSQGRLSPPQGAPAGEATVAVETSDAAGATARLEQVLARITKETEEAVSQSADTHASAARDVVMAAGPAGVSVSQRGLGGDG